MISIACYHIDNLKLILLAICQDTMGLLNEFVTFFSTKSTGGRSSVDFNIAVILNFYVQSLLNSRVVS